MYHSVCNIAGGNQHHPGHSAVQPVPRNPDGSSDDQQQHGPDNDRGHRGYIRHDPDSGGRVRHSEQTSREKDANVAQFGRVLPPE